MANMSKNKCPMPSQAPQIRKNNFLEVATGYTYDMAIEVQRGALIVRLSPVSLNVRLLLIFRHLLKSLHPRI